jgi:beta-galactosidase/evolved beta-galactosidase subunit alpha
VLKLRNKQDFASLDHLRIHWRVETDGLLNASGTVPTPYVAAGQTALLELPLNLPPQTSAGERWLTVTFSLAHDTLWAIAGHEVAWAQFQLPAATIPAPVGFLRPAVQVEHSGNHAILRGDGWEMEFDTVRGHLRSWINAGTHLLASGPRLNLWRAITDNDRSWGNAAEKLWRDHGLHWLQHRTSNVQLDRTEGGGAIIIVESVVAPPNSTRAVLVKYTYHVNPDGSILLETDGEFRGKWPDYVARIGLQMALPAALDHATWFGRGPGESYADTKQAARIGRWTRSVDEMFTPYIVPQENGNHTESRWLLLTNNFGCGLKVAGRPHFDFSAHWYTTQDLDHARHSYDLKRRPIITLNLDLAQNGIGSNSCGPMPWPQYLLKPENFRFELLLSARA